MNSNAARKGTPDAALLAASRTFSAAPSLGLEDRPAEAGASLGRRRLAGAYFIEISRISPDPAQPRRSLLTEDYQELTASVRRLGILQPISVRYLEAEGVYRIISGERRFQAAKAAGLAEVPCWVQSPQDTDILLRQVVENWQRVDLAPFELADSLLAIKETNGVTQKQLAELTGKSEAEISRLLSLHDLEPTVQEAARAEQHGRLSLRHLMAVARHPRSAQRSFLDSILLNGLTARQAEALSDVARPTPTGARARGAPTVRVRYVTPSATVLLTFRRKNVTTEEILAALDEARAAASAEQRPELNIARAK